MFIFYKDVNKMNIAFVSPKIYPCIIDGLEIFNYYFIKELASKGHTILVVTRYNYNWTNKNIQHIKMRFLTKFRTPDSRYLSMILEMMKLKNKIDIAVIKEKPFLEMMEIEKNLSMAKEDYINIFKRISLKNYNDINIIYDIGDIYAI
jgi:hypothetical protein